MSRPPLPAIVLVVGLACTAVVSAALWQAAERSEDQRFRAGMERVRAEIQERLSTHAALLQAGTGLFAASDVVGRETFARFVDRLEIGTRYTGIQGVGYAASVPAERRGELESRLRLGWGGDLPERGVWPGAAPGLDAVTAIVYLEPRDRRNLAAIGYDMYAEPVRREAMARARDTGGPAASAPVTLVQEIDSDVQPGFLVYLPVYEGGRVPGTVEERRAGLRGYLYSPVRAWDFVGEAMRRAADSGLGVAVRDGSGGDLYAPEAPPDGARTAAVSVGGREWIVRAWPRARAGGAGRALPLAAVGVGAAISGLLWGLVRAQARAREGAERAAEAVRQERERFATTLASIGDGVVATDGAGVVTFINGVAADLLGRPAAQCVGRPLEDVFVLVHERTRAPMESPVARCLREGTVVELANHAAVLRPDNTGVPIEDSAAPIRGARGEVTGAVLVFRDVSDRRGERERLRTQSLVLESMAEGVSLSDARGIIEYTNPAEDRMFGYGPGELVGRPVTVLNDLEPAENERVVGAVIDTLNEKGEWVGEWRNRRKDGTPFWTRSRITRLDLEDGPRFVCVQEDVTERRAAEARVRELNAALRAKLTEMELLMEALPVGVFIAHDPGCQSITANAAGLRMLGVGPGQNPSKTGPEAERLGFRTLRDGVEVAPEDLPMQRCCRDGTPVEGETLEIVRSDGSVLHLFEHVVPLLDEGGRVRGCVGVFVDTTELQRAAAAARASEEQLRLVTDRLPALVAYVGPDLRYRFVNPQYEEWFGLGAAEAVGRSVPEVLGGAAFEALRGRIEGALRGERQSFEGVVPYARGGPREIAAEYIPHVVGGRVQGYVSLISDVTRQRRAERDRLFLAEAAAVLAGRRSIDETLSAVAALAVPRFADWCVVDLVEDPADPGGSLRRAAAAHADPARAGAVEAYARLYPADPSREAGPARVARTGEPELVPEVSEETLRSATGGPDHSAAAAALGVRSYMCLPLRAGGRVLGVLSFVSAGSGRRYGPEDLEHAGALAGSVAAALENARLVAEREDTERRFRTMADGAPVLIRMAGTDGAGTWFNRPWLEFVGRPMELELGDGWTGGVHPEDRERVVRAYRAALAERREFRMTYRLRRHDGRHRAVMDHGVPLLDGAGAFAGYIGSCVDVTEMEEARRTLQAHGEELERVVAERTDELERSHRHLRHAERLASLGTLAAGIGHDLGNLLLPIRVRLDTMRRKGPPEIAEDIVAIEKAAEYLAQLSQGLRLLARDPDEPGAAGERTDLALWWGLVEGLLKNALPRSVVLESRLAPGLPPVRLGTAGLTQAVFNLVQNAGDAMRSRGSGRVTVWAERGAGAGGEGGGAGDSATVRLGVTDDGPGMTPEVMRRCLEPFFTTKARGLSTGMGLSLVSGVVRRAGGAVEVRSEPGLGATFVLTLPAGAAEPGAAAGAAGSGLAAALTLADARTAAFVRAVALEMGMRVEEASGGAAPPGADLWVADASVDEVAVRAFLHANAARRIVRVGSVAAGAGAVGGHEGREWRVPAGLRPLALRKALAEAASELGPRSCAGGVE